MIKLMTVTGKNIFKRPFFLPLHVTHSTMQSEIERLQRIIDEVDGELSQVVERNGQQLKERVCQSG